MNPTLDVQMLEAATLSLCTSNNRFIDPPIISALLGGLLPW